MTDFNIKKVDFLGLDIDKYLDWLLNKYKLFSEVYEIAYLDEKLDSLHGRKFFANSHYIATRNKTLPENIKNAYDTRIEPLQVEKGIQKKKFESIHFSELIFFESISNTYKYNEQNKYSLFSKDELKHISIDNSFLKMWFDKDLGNAFIDETNERLTSSPLKETAFYQKELDFLLENSDFKYLPQILDGLFIYDLDNQKNALSFATEIDKIRQAIYLTEQIQGETAHHQPTKPIQWTAQVNSLVTVFNELLTANIIKNERGTKENIKRILLNNFVNADGLELSKNSINEVFNPSKMKTDKAISELIKPLLEHLQKK